MVLKKLNDIPPFYFKIQLALTEEERNARKIKMVQDLNREEEVTKICYLAGWSLLLLI